MALTTSSPTLPRPPFSFFLVALLVLVDLRLIDGALDLGAERVQAAQHRLGVVVALGYQVLGGAEVEVDVRHRSGLNPSGPAPGKAIRRTMRPPAQLSWRAH